ncbi:MAG: radical SAM family heme chaperone HemW [Gammaproteobacteria bacterium]|nr:radical SAM family heme chaperone HemW [Gammaproteobacteria bacterium]
MMLPPLSLYIHIPWCIKKCPYCDFNSHALNGDIPETRYIERLLEDLRYQMAYAGGRKIHSIFFGGGTPSLMSSDAIARLLDYVSPLTNGEETEITLECNPGTLDALKTSGWKKAGVNRLSIGVQSLQNKHLASIGRIHNADEARRMINTARDAGFDNINLDLMYGLPGQSLDSAMMDLQQATDFLPEHLSWYQLTLEPNTYFYSHPPKLPDEDLIWDIQNEGASQLTQCGYTRYEVSAWARYDPVKFRSLSCQHNLNYWQFGDYIGLGAGAHGKISLSSGRVYRTAYPRMPETFLQIAQLNEREKPDNGDLVLPGVRSRLLTEEDLISEFLMNSLRLRNGFLAMDFTEKTGLPIEVLSDFLSAGASRGLLVMKPSTEQSAREFSTAEQRIMTTDKGFDHLDELLTLAIR